MPFIEKLLAKQNLSSDEEVKRQIELSIQRDGSFQETYEACLEVYANFKLGRIQITEAAKIRWLESIIAEFIEKACWTLANIFAEGILATELISMQVVEKLMDVAHTVSTFMRGENYSKS